MIYLIQFTFIFLGYLLKTSNANPYLGAPFFVQKAFQDCKREQNVNVPKSETKFRISGPLNLPIYDAKFACLNKCTLEKSGILSSTGVVNTTELPQELKTIATECDNISTPLKDCERAHNLTICFIEKSRSLLNHTVMDCAQQTNTQVDEFKAYKFKDFLKEKKFYCMNRCVLIRLSKMDENNGVKVDSLKFTSPPNANIPEIVEKCVEDNHDENQCKMDVKRALCISKKMGKLSEELLKN